MSTLTVTRVTHSCVLLDFAGIKILTDPWFSERPGYLRGEPLAYTPESLPHLDGVLVSHGHYDAWPADRHRHTRRTWCAGEHLCCAEPGFHGLLWRGYAFDSGAARGSHPLSADRPRAPGREWPADPPGLQSP